MARRRPVKRLLDHNQNDSGYGRAEIIEKPSQLEHLLWSASRGATGARNVALIWFLFGSGTRINETCQILVKDVFHKNGDLKTVFAMPASYTKTNHSRAIYVLLEPHRTALEEWRKQRVVEEAMISDDGSYGGLRGDSPLFLARNGKRWQTLAFRDKKYLTAEGKTKTTKVCGSMENLMRKLFKGAGLHNGSSHSGRRTLASWLDRKGYSLELIQLILDHKSPDMTLRYIEPYQERIETAFKSLWKGVKLPKYEGK